MIEDPLMQAHSLSALTLQQRAWAGMHQCYSDRYVWEEIQQGNLPSDEDAGWLVVKHLLAGNRGHFGPLEELGITISCGYVPHSVMQQLRTHRIGVTFDCQSMRYTCKALLHAAAHSRIDFEHVERVIYFRPPGEYRNEGKRYTYSQETRYQDLVDAERAIATYAHKVSELGFAPEHARGMLPFDYRQHFVVSFNNIRALWHMADLRLGKGDVQGEAELMMKRIWDAAYSQAPVLNDWYIKQRYGKARLAP